MQWNVSRATSGREVGHDPTQIVGALRTVRRGAMAVAVIDGPYQPGALSRILAQRPMDLGDGHCDANPNSACRHGTFIMGLLGAGKNTPLPGLCPECDLVHVPLFADDPAPEANVAELARAIDLANSAGARLINLSVAICGDEQARDRDLALALDRAETSGAVLMAAAGNQGRLATGQILSHPVVVPVVAVDRSGQLLPGCNFGPSISGFGVAALGHNVWGYTPAGGRTTMSGTSVATAVATGIVAQVWVARPHIHGKVMRAALARLQPRNGATPPLLTRDNLMTAIDRLSLPASADAAPRTSRNWVNSISFQGDVTMNDQNGPQRDFSHDVAGAVAASQTAIPAQVVGGCSCGGAPGECSCGSGRSRAMSFVYVLGTIDVRIPNQSVADELARVARTKDIRRHPGEDRRSWCHRILTSEGQISGRATSRMLDVRHLARQLEWILTVEGVPAYYLSLRDPVDFDDLVELLGEPKPAGPTPAPVGGASPNKPPPQADLREEAKPKGKRESQARSARSKADAIIAEEDFDVIANPYGHKRKDGGDLSLVVGKSCLALVERFPGIVAPVLTTEYLSSFEQEELASWIRTSQGKVPTPPPNSRPRALTLNPQPNDLFKRLAQTADNFGDTDEWRALNYLAANYKPLYVCYADMLQAGYALDDVKVLRSRLWGGRRVVDPVFTFVNDAGAIEKYFVRVDVTDLFPNIVNDIFEYFDR
jgi:hypothetical protein